MKLPKRVLIFGQLVKVEKAKLDHHIDGLYWPKGLIQISEQAKRDHVPLVFIHELIHAVIARTSLHQVINGETEEIICDSIAKAITENFTLKAKDHIK